MKKQSKGTVRSLDGKRTVSLEEFDRIADSGSDEIDEFLDWSKAKRGGARPGAGRKPKESVRLQVSLRPEVREKLRRQATQRGMTQTALLEEAITRL
ncbi:MAG: hypothetical protein R3F07_11925 [Opitutaceae bacterium]